MRIALAVLGSLVILVWAQTHPPISSMNARADQVGTPAPKAAPGSRTKLRDGTITLYSDKHLRLEATVRRGRIVSIQPVNVSGRITRFYVKQQKDKKGKEKRPCIYCYDLDKVLESNCKEIACDQLPKVNELRR